MIKDVLLYIIFIISFFIVFPRELGQIPWRMQCSHGVYQEKTGPRFTEIGFLGGNSDVLQYIF